MRASSKGFLPNTRYYPDKKEQQKWSGVEKRRISNPVVRVAALQVAALHPVRDDPEEPEPGRPDVVVPEALGL